MRAMPSGRATDGDRRAVFSAALGQFDELLDAAAAVGPASRPLPLYYALNQAGRAIVAARLTPDRPWRPILHGLSIGGPEDGTLQSTTITPQSSVNDKRAGSFHLLAEAIGASPRDKPLGTSPLSNTTSLRNVWAAIPGLDKPGLGAGCPRALPLGFGSLRPWPTTASLTLTDWPPVDESKGRLQEFLAETYPAAADGLAVQSIRRGESEGMAAAQAQLAWKKPSGTPLPIWTGPTRYLAPESLWLLPKLSSGDTLAPILLWWCLLQALSSLARYHPASGRRRSIQIGLGGSVDREGATHRARRRAPARTDDALARRRVRVDTSRLGHQRQRRSRDPLASGCSPPRRHFPSCCTGLGAVVIVGLTHRRTVASQHVCDPKSSAG